MDRDQRHDDEHPWNQELPELQDGWDMDEESEGKRRRPAWLLRLAAAIALVAFIALSYAWLPLIAPSHFEFLRQDRELSGEAVVKASKPAVVSITATIPDGIPGSTRGGTGFNIASEGLVVTNRHVVDGAASIMITFSDYRRFYSKQYQIIEKYDLAVIRIKGQGLPVLPLSYTLPAIDEEVTVIGNPLGYQRVSARGPVEGYYDGGEAGAAVFAIRAIAEPGSSGSPVIDRQGRVCGVVYAITSIRKDGKEIRYSLAIPADALKALSISGS
ncbi:MAG: S1C family serine protease [Deltaproteobacteria bacterium]